MLLYQRLNSPKLNNLIPEKLLPGRLNRRLHHKTTSPFLFKGNLQLQSLQKLFPCCYFPCFEVVPQCVIPSNPIPYPNNNNNNNNNNHQTFASGFSLAWLSANFLRSSMTSFSAAWEPLNPRVELRWCLPSLKLTASSHLKKCSPKGTNRIISLSISKKFLAVSGREGGFDLPWHPLEFRVYTNLNSESSFSRRSGANTMVKIVGGVQKHVTISTSLTISV